MCYFFENVFLFSAFFLWEIPFYFNLLTNEHTFVQPPNYTKVVDNLIPKNIIQEKLKSRDEFSFGKNIISAGNKNDENCLDYIEERALGADPRKKISKFNSQRDNFVFVIESLFDGGLQLGSGVLVRSVTKKFGLTAGHVVTHNSSGVIQKVINFILFSIINCCRISLVTRYMTLAKKVLPCTETCSKKNILFSNNVFFPNGKFLSEILDNYKFISFWHKLFSISHYM